MVSQSAWIDYDIWNQAIADVVFPELARPLPVYLDLEDEQLTALGVRLDLDPDAVEAELCRVVGLTVQGDLGRGMFKPHLRRLQRWREAGDPSQPPPTLALLAVFSLAAERMARGEGLRENNFYGRLREVLGLDPAERSVNDGYRRGAEIFWGTLNRWLSDLNGLRGLPTAYSLSHRYVGLALSQALVRQADRQRLLAFFRRFDLSPGTDIPPAELEPLLDAWITLVPSPATRNLTRLWSKEAVRDRIAQAAAVALANWDGVIDDDDVAAAEGKILLTLEINTFPAKSLKVRALVFAPRAEGARTAIIHTRDGDEEVPLEPGFAGALDLGTGTTLDPASTFEGMLRITDQLTGARLEHRPRRLMAFRRDPLSNRLIEANQVMLGDDHVLVVHHQLVARVHTVLAKIARPGWLATSEGLPGLPDGWEVIKGVEVFASPGDLVQGLSDLSALIPITRTQLRVGGGLALPGAVRNKWHTWAPPEIRAVSEIPGFTVTLLAVPDADDEADPEELAHWSDHDAGFLVGKISELDLGDGDYRLELRPDGALDATSALHLRLRTGDTPDKVQWAAAASLSHCLRDPLSALGAGTEVDGPSVQGAVVTNPDSNLTSGTLPEASWWTSAHKRSADVQGIQSILADPDSCLVTGKHHEQVDYVPPDKHGRPSIKTTASTCLGCGLTKKYSTNYYANRFKHSRRQAQPEVRALDVSVLPEVDLETSAQWDLALDGLMHLGGGKWSLLERLAMNIEPSAIFVDHFARALESLGHIEVRRDHGTLLPVEWEVSPTTVARTRDGWVLTGFWTDGLQQHFAIELHGPDAGAEQTPQAVGPSRWHLNAEEAALRIHAADLGAVVVRDAWRDLASSLPTLSAVVAALPRRSLAEGGPIRWFDPRATAWVSTKDAQIPGAYRFGKYGALDVIRTPEDVERGQTSVSQVYLSKHAAVQMLTGQVLVAFNRATEELHVPLGADLPGLYGRSAVLASGLLPTKSGGNLVYHQVPHALAQHLAHLLGN